MCAWSNFCHSSWRNPVLFYFPQSQTGEGSELSQGCLEMQKRFLELWMWTHFSHALAVVCCAIHCRYGDWTQSCGCPSSPFSDLSSIFKAFLPVKVTNTDESLKIAMFELRTEFTDGVLGECYFRAITEFGDQPNFQAKWGWFLIAFRRWVGLNFYFEG